MNFTKEELLDLIDCLEVAVDVHADCGIIADTLADRYDTLLQRVKDQLIQTVRTECKEFRYSTKGNRSYNAI